MKKKILAVLLSAAMALSLTACSNGTGGKEPGGFDNNNDLLPFFNITYPNEGDFEIEERDNGVAIVRYLNYDNTDVEIPPTIGGKKVVEICDWAFSTSALENITIPGSVTKFGKYALASTAWYDNKLEESPFVIVNNIVIGADAEKCAGSITIPNGVTGIADYAFYRCEGLTSIALPEGLTEIGEAAFNVCTNLSSITLPKGLTKIGDYAFSGCTDLANITIPDSVNEIGRNAFYYTPWLESKLKESDMLVVGSVLFDGRGCSGSVTIPGGVTTIGENAFERNTGITSVTIPEGVTKIGYRAFSGCTNLTDITIPNSVTEIITNNDRLDFGELMDADTMSGFDGSVFGTPFEGTPWLENKRKEDPLVVVNNILIDGKKCSGSVTIPNGVTKIEDGAFCQSPIGGLLALDIKNVTIPDSVTEIGSFAFAGTKLTGIKVPQSVRKIGDAAFCNCDLLTSIELPDNSDMIGAHAFYRCVDLTSIDIPRGVSVIGTDAFRECVSLENVKLPDSVTIIGTNAFRSCYGISNVDIPDSVTAIGRSAFGFCKSLTSINIPDSVICIGDMAFSGCTGLTSVKIPDSVTKIGAGAFMLCENLENISLGKGVLEFQKYYDSLNYNESRPFTDCRALTTINVADGNPKYCSIDGMLFQKEENGKLSLVACPEARDGEVTLPDGFTKIGDYAFSRCVNLTSVNIPNGVTEIGDGAFLQCENLTSVNIPDGVTEIGAGAFQLCENLTSINIPDSVTKIDGSGRGAFYGCRNITITYKGSTYNNSMLRELFQ